MAAFTAALSPKVAENGLPQRDYNLYELSFILISSPLSRQSATSITLYAPCQVEINAPPLLKMFGWVAIDVRNRYSWEVIRHFGLASASMDLKCSLVSSTTDYETEVRFQQS